MLFWFAKLRSYPYEAHFAPPFYINFLKVCIFTYINLIIIVNCTGVGLNQFYVSASEFFVDFNAVWNCFFDQVPKSF